MDRLEHPINHHVSKVQYGISVIIIGIFNQCLEIFLIEAVIRNGDKAVNILFFNMSDDLISHLLEE